MRILVLNGSPRLQGNTAATAVAVHGACVKIQGLVTVLINGMGSGLIPIVAYNYGAKKPKRIYKSGRWAMPYFTIFYSIFFLMYALLKTLHFEEEMKMAVKQTAGRDLLGDFAPKFAQLNDDAGTYGFFFPFSSGERKEERNYKE